MIISGDIRLKSFPAPGCSLQLRKIEVKHDKRSGSSRGVIYHPSTLNNHVSTDLDGAAWIAHRAIGLNRDATVDSTSRRWSAPGRTDRPGPAPQRQRPGVLGRSD